MKIQIIISNRTTFYFGDKDISKYIVICDNEFNTQTVVNNLPQLQEKYKKFCGRMNLKYEGVDYELV